jgi:hypothetical protein
MLADGTIIGTSHDMAGTSESDISSYSDTCSETHSRGRHRSESVQVSGASGEAHAVQETRSKSASAGASESTSRVPFYEYEKQWRPSSRTFESEAEFLTKKLQRIKGLPQAHAFVKVPGKTGRFLRLPRVRTPWLPERTRNAGYARIFDRSFYFKPGEPVIAEDLASPTERSPKSLPAAKTGEDLTRCARNALAEVRAVAVEAQNRDEDFAGPDVPIAPRKTRKKKT